MATEKMNPSTKRSLIRRRSLRIILAAAGWESESEFLTAIGNGIVRPPINPNIAVRLDGNSSKESTKLVDIGG